MIAFLIDYVRKQRIKRAEHKNEVQVIEANSEKFGAMVQHEIKLQQVELANKIVDLKQKVSLNDIEAERQTIQLHREVDELERAKSEFRVYLDGERQKQELDRERFYLEQAREDKRLEQDYTIRMGELHLRHTELTNKHEAEMERIKLDREKHLSEVERMEAEKVQRVLEAMMSSAALAADRRHTERIKELEVDAKRFELEILAARLLNDEAQQNEMRRIRLRMQERMAEFIAQQRNDSGVHGAY